MCLCLLCWEKKNPISHSYGCFCFSGLHWAEVSDPHSLGSFVDLIQPTFTSVSATPADFLFYTFLCKLTRVCNLAWSEPTARRWTLLRHSEMSAAAGAAPPQFDLLIISLLRISVRGTVKTGSVHAAGKHYNVMILQQLLRLIVIDFGLK